MRGELAHKLMDRNIHSLESTVDKLKEQDALRDMRAISLGTGKLFPLDVAKNKFLRFERINLILVLEKAFPKRAVLVSGYLCKFYAYEAAITPNANEVWILNRMENGGELFAGDPLVCLKKRHPKYDGK